VFPLDLLSAGEAFDDLIFSGLSHLPRPGEELKTDRFERTVGGGALITAIAASRLGLRVGVASALGTPAVDALEHERIDAVNLRRRHEPAALSVALSTSRDRSFVTFNGVNALLESRLLRAIDDRSARHVHLALAPTRCGAWARLVSRLGRAGITSSWDFGWNPELRRDPDLSTLVAALDIVFLNESEARLYSGARTDGGAVTWWRRRARVTVIKRGRHGALCLTANGTTEAPGIRSRAVETTGAGDAFDAGFLCGLLDGAPSDACLRLGNAMGSLSTLAAGGIAGLPSRTEGQRLVARLLGRGARPTRARRRTG